MFNFLFNEFEHTLNKVKIEKENRKKTKIEKNRKRQKLYTHLGNVLSKL